MSKLKLDKKIEAIVKEVSRYMTHVDFDCIKNEVFKAYEYAYAAHDGQNRLSGEPFIIHPITATEILLALKPDIFTIQACLLHDVVEDTDKTNEDIKKEFGEEVAVLCEGLTKVSKVKYKGEERVVGDLRKMFVAMAGDLRVIFIKLVDRLHNMRTLMYHPKKEKRDRIALDTLTIFSPIADRLGLHRLHNALNEECFKVLDPENYKKLKKEMNELKPKIDIFLDTAKEEIKSLLKGKIRKYEVDCRVKSIYSIYKKLLKKGLTKAGELYDLFGIRVIVKTETDCYKVLGLIHQKWIPLPNRFKDYIALPKPNGYESLHTSVLGLFVGDRYQPTEIQIKTFEMLKSSDIGVAAHFEYKEKGSKISSDIDWVKELKEMVNSVGDTDLLGALKVDVFKDRIYTFTPKGDFINLPVGSTPIDFAYAIHSKFGDHISIAKVNGMVYPLDKELKNGDVVEIITDKNKRPNLLRISFVKTIKAKNRIRFFLKKENKDLYRERGRDIVSKYFEKFGLKLDKDLTILKNIGGKDLNMDDRWSLLEQIGNFSITPFFLVKKVLKAINPNQYEKKKKKTVKLTQKDKKSKEKQIIIGGEIGLHYKLCGYCKRNSTKNIVAHINNKGIITIHKVDCKILENVNKERLLPAYIEGEQNELLFVTIKLIFKEKLEILKIITETTLEMGINIESMVSKKFGKTKKELNLKLSIKDNNYLLLDRFIERIKILLKDVLVECEFI